MTSIKVKVIRRPQIKVKALVRFPANVVTQNFLTVTNSGGTYTFSVDYSLLGPGPVTDPTTAYVAVQDQTSGIYRTVTLASLLTSGLDADLQAIAALTTTGILVRTASNTWVLRAVTGTANEITVTNGDGVAGAPTVSLPAALTFTGKTVTGGTFNSPALVTPTLGVASATTINKVTITQPATSATLTLIDGTTLTGPAASGTVMTLGNTETVTGVKTFGSAGAVGRLKVAGTTSGSTVLDATAIASGTLTLPAATDTLVGKATTDILTNKTYDTAGAGNSFSINSLAATANTGTGAVVRATSPVLVTPALGTPTALVLTSATGLPLSGLTTQGAYTIVANNTGGAAVPTAMDISAITSKASPISADIVLIQDSAASNAFKRTTVGALSSAGSVASYNGRTGAVTATGTDVPLRSYLAGLKLSTSGVSNTLSISAGVTTDSTNVSMMSLSSFTKTSAGAGAWVVGSGNSGLDTGTLSATWYHFFVIQRPDTGVVDVCYSLSATAPTTGGNIPAAYTLSRRIGSSKLDGGANWIQFVQDGDLFQWLAPVADISATNPGTAAVSRTLTVPPGVNVLAILQVITRDSGASANVDVFISDLAITDTASTINLTDVTRVVNGVANSDLQGAARVEVRTNTSAQVRSRLSGSGASSVLVMNTLGWKDRRGKDS